jgi:hypothetical protein
MEIGAMRLEPGFGAIRFRIQPVCHAPKGLGMIHMHEMGDFVRSQIFENEGRRENETPGKIKRARRRARAPTACRIAEGDAPPLYADRGAVALGRGLQIAPRFALEEIRYAPRDMRAISSDTYNRAAFAFRGPDNAARAWAVNNTMVDAAQRRKARWFEKNLCGKPLELRADPGGVTFGEFARRLDRSALGHRQDDIARGGANAQRESPRRSQPLQSDTVNRAAMSDFEMSDLSARRAALKETQHMTMNKRARAESLVRQSITGEEISYEQLILSLRRSSQCH